METQKLVDAVLTHAESVAGRTKVSGFASKDRKPKLWFTPEIREKIKAKEKARDAARVAANNPGKSEDATLLNLLTCC